MDPKNICKQDPGQEKGDQKYKTVKKQAVFEG
jgi:hypothetical protein